MQGRSHSVNIIPLWNYIDSEIYRETGSPYMRQGSMVYTISASAQLNNTAFQGVARLRKDALFRHTTSILLLHSCKANRINEEAL